VVRLVATGGVIGSGVGIAAMAITAGALASTKKKSANVQVCVLLPDTVSFQWIAVREHDADFVGTGYYIFDNGKSHLHFENVPTPTPVTPTKIVPGKGWYLDQVDNVWSGRMLTPRPFEPGYASVYIPWEYTDAGETTDIFHVFWHVSQTCELMKDGSTIEAAKGAAKVKMTVDSPDYR